MLESVPGNLYSLAEKLDPSIAQDFPKLKSKYQNIPRR